MLLIVLHILLQVTDGGNLNGYDAMRAHPHTGHSHNKNWVQLYARLYLVSILQIMDDLSWADNIVQDILVSCRLEITINMELWIIINGLPSLPTDVINLLCPEECSGHGTCNNGMLWFNCSPVSLLGLRVLLFFPCTHHPAPLPWHSPPVA